MIVGRRSISLQGSNHPLPARTLAAARGGAAAPLKSPSKRSALCRASHTPYTSHEQSPADRVARHFDDRNQMFPAADLLRLVGNHKHDPGYKHLLPWMMRLETALEFMADLETDAIEADDPQERGRALRGALKNAQGIRQLLDAFDPFLADEPELFEAPLQAADAALEQRILELGRLSRQGASTRPSLPPPTNSGVGLGSLWARWQQEMESHVERRDGPPPPDYDPLAFIKKTAQDRRT